MRNLLISCGDSRDRWGGFPLSGHSLTSTTMGQTSASLEGLHLELMSSRLRCVVRCALQGTLSSAICCVDASLFSYRRTGWHMSSWGGELSVTCDENLSNLWSLGLFLQWSGFSHWQQFLDTNLRTACTRSYFSHLHLHDGLTLLSLFCDLCSFVDY